MKTAFACVLLGLAALIVINSTSNVEVTPIEKINALQDKEVAIEGRVEGIIQSQGMTVIEVGYDTSIKVVLFEKADLRRGDRVVVTGITKEYNGRLEIVAEKIVVK